MKTRSFIFYILSFTLLFMVMFQTETGANTKKTYEVGTSNLNVRVSPSHDAPVVGHLQTGDKITAFKEANGWVQTYFEDDVAWVASQYLVETASETKSTPEVKSSSDKVEIIASGVNVRSGPGTNYSITGSTTSGDTYKLIEATDSWVKIGLANGSGWVAAELTSLASSSANSDQSSEPATEGSNDSIKNSDNGSLSGYTIVLDPGHGGKDPGSIGFNNVHEKDLINQTTEKVAQHLRHAGANVVLTRTQDSYISLDQRIQISNSYRTDAFISLHYNAFPVPVVRGLSTYYYSGGDDKTLAHHLQSSLATVGGVYDRGIRRGDYKVLRENKDLAVLIELGFITNPDELQTLQTAAFQNGAAQAITDGLINYFSQ